MKRFFEFLRKERLYILLLVFIVLVHMIIVTASGTKTARQTAKVQATASTVVRQDDVEAKQPAILTTEARRAELEKVFSEKKQLAVLFALTSLLIIAVFLLGIAVDVLFLSAISGAASLFRYAICQHLTLQHGLLALHLLLERPLISADREIQAE